VREIDNAAGNQVGKFLITGADLAPESDVILLPLGEETGAGARACDAPQLPLPKAGYLTSTPDETGGQDRTFGSLNGAHGNRPIEIQVGSADLRFGMRADLPRDVRRGGELLLDRGMQPPALAMPDERGTA
jgi:hypothetical protein